MAVASENASRLIAILVALSAGILLAAQVGKLPSSLPVLQSDLGLSLVQAGWVSSAINAVTALLGLVSGLLAARRGTRTALLAGLFIAVLGGALGALSVNGSLLLGSRVLEGVGFVLVVVAAPSIIAASATPAGRGGWLAVWGCYMPLGVSAMLLLSPVLIGAGGWRLLWWVNVALLGALLLLALLLRAHLPQARAPGGRPLRAQLRHAVRLRGPVLMGLAFGAYSAQWFMIITWLPSFGVSHMGLALHQAGWLAALATFANVVGCLAAAPLSRRGVPRWVVALGVQLLMGLTGLIVFTAALEPSLRLVMAVLGCGLGGLLPATLFIGVPQLVERREDVGMGNGLITQGANIGILLGPPAIAAVVAHLGGWDAGRWLFVVLAALGVMVALALRAHEQTLKAAAPSAA
ncbi:MFS transporter [Alkalilimnicola sp. S0819]|uniref:MFS transporter n=1 Tax=Alkalilimnicola sp. S0819 TaxID=2613922 RepID=UPI0018699E11|nr:MFS transporter [Alkalilimnicola sp. S0819]